MTTPQTCQFCTHARKATQRDLDSYEDRGSRASVEVSSRFLCVLAETPDPVVGAWDSGGFRGFVLTRSDFGCNQWASGTPAPFDPDESIG